MEIFFSDFIGFYKKSFNCSNSFFTAHILKTFLIANQTSKQTLRVPSNGCRRRLDSTSVSRSPKSTQPPTTTAAQSIYYFQHNSVWSAPAHPFPPPLVCLTLINCSRIKRTTGTGAPTMSVDVWMREREGTRENERERNAEQPEGKINKSDPHCWAHRSQNQPSLSFFWLSPPLVLFRRLSNPARPKDDEVDEIFLHAALLALPLSLPLPLSRSCPSGFRSGGAFPLLGSFCDDCCCCCLPLLALVVT